MPPSTLETAWLTLSRWKSIYLLRRDAATVGEGGCHAWQSIEENRRGILETGSLGPLHFVDIEGCSDRSPTPMLQASNDLDQIMGRGPAGRKRRHTLPRKGARLHQRSGNVLQQRAAGTDDRAGRDILRSP